MDGAEAGSYRAGPCAELDLQGVSEGPTGSGSVACYRLQRGEDVRLGKGAEGAAARTETAKGLGQKARSGWGSDDGRRGRCR
jgi:hypothetical protein